MTTENRITFADRWKTAQTGYVSIPAVLARSKDPNEILAQVKKAFPSLRLGAFHTEFEDRKDWRECFDSCIKDMDALIIVCDSSRLIGAGQMREIMAARAAGKLITIFKTDDNETRRFYGYAKTGSKRRPIIRLKKRDEVLKVAA